MKVELNDHPEALGQYSQTEIDDAMPALVRLITHLSRDKSLICDEMRWAKLLDSHEYAVAQHLLELDTVLGQ